MAISGMVSAEDRAKADANEDSARVTDVVSLDAPALRESSGLAASRRRNHRFWTHNDSGGLPKLYAFDSTGSKTGQARLRSAQAIDWEDMAAFTDHGVARLLVADCGDNRARRKSVTLYMFDEPDPDESTDVKQVQAIRVSYQDGPGDCEAVAVDEVRRQIVMVMKSKLPAAALYVLPLPNRTANRAIGAPISVTANRMATIPVPIITAMDVDQSTGAIWLASSFQAFCFRCQQRDTAISIQLAALPSSQELPRWKQIEAVAVDTASNVWITSEGSPTPMGRLPQTASAQQPAD